MVRAIVTTFLTLALLLSSLPAAAKEAVTEAATARIDPTAGSRVSGTATLTFSTPDTRALVELRGLEPGTSAVVTVHAGPCDGQSASFVALPEVTADSRGRATADGLLLFQGREPVELATLIDEEHSISVSGAEGQAACGEILAPGEEPDSPPPGEERTPPWYLIAGIATLLLLAAAAFAYSRRRRSKAGTA